MSRKPDLEEPPIEDELKRSRSLSKSLKGLFKSTSPPRKPHGTPESGTAGVKTADKLKKLAKSKEMELEGKRRDHAAGSPAKMGETPLPSPAVTHRPQNGVGAKNGKPHSYVQDFGKLAVSKPLEGDNISQESVISDDDPKLRTKSSYVAKQPKYADSLSDEGEESDYFHFASGGAAGHGQSVEETTIDNELAKDPDTIRRVKSLQRRSSNAGATPRSRSLSFSSRYRGRSPTQSSSHVLRETSENENNPKCVMKIDTFKLFENGTHKHTLKVTPFVSENQDDDAKGKSMFSLSGFFKGHKDDEKLESALSLLPRTRFEFHKRLSRILDDELKDENGDPEDKNKERNMPKPVNPNAAIGSEELGMINKISKKIHDGGAKEGDTDEQIAKKNYTLFQKYGKPIGVIGHGAYGVVKVCCIDVGTVTDERLVDETYVNGSKMYYAVKKLKPKADEPKEKFGTRLTSEFIIGHALSQRGNDKQKSHPNILKMLDLMQTNDGFVEVLEFCPSGDLYSLLSRTSKNGLHPLEADCFMKQLLHGVQYMHDHGIAHCDLKPENILFEPQGTLKICDFGTSCVFQTAWEKQVHFQSGAVGSEPYVAPEEFIAQREYDPRLVDCWSCGIIYCTMVLGHYLWKIPLIDRDPVYASFVEEMRMKREYNVFEDLKHVSPEVNRCRKLCLYAIFQWNPDKRTSVEKLLHSNWMKRTWCCVTYKNPRVAH
ncbi:LANO_0G04324g1_1 [Lachancea nothofagi CBS 11611]|uniref:non-specific serine/threonine protein kinase n=1 Tax=Lachancea nothofagi CBS 11611 TaxID=1266666 RepID=A0A1G4KFX9_9SACH|nr:LANO_0G04324g1_1 [Lachancea nothofagi CBS 11611]